MRSLQDWLAWQESLHPRAVDLGLERVRQVAETLGAGRFRIPVVTVGGTNGKGSCAALLESILQSAGYRVGVFTSPHLTHYTERIRIAGQRIAPAALVEAFERIDAARGAATLTFFEFNTLAALLAFAAAPLDAVVLEVGLGGRLDAVNLVDADVALLSSIGLDHCEWLGDTLEAIGREKAGIFRAGRPAIIGSPPVPASVRDCARERGAILRESGVHFGYRAGAAAASDAERRWSWHGVATRLDELPWPALAGRHQLDNAAAVLAVLEALQARLPVPATALAAGLRDVQLPGRFQRISQRAEWVLDVAHNPDAARRLGATLAEHPAQGRTIAIVGILKDKDAASVVSAVEAALRADGGARAVEWIAVDLPGPRGLSGSELRRICGYANDPRWSTAPSVAAACQQARRLAGVRDRVLVFGSFHTVGPALEWLQGAMRSA